MKNIVALALSLAILIILISCGGTINVQKPTDFQFEVIDNGTVLRLTWSETDLDVEGYYIYADGIAIDTLRHESQTSYDATIPAAVYGVSAYFEDDESEPAEVDCTPVETANITIYGNSDPNPDHPSGIGFTTDGICVTLDINDPANHPDIDFYFDDVLFSMMAIVSPNLQPSPYNAEKNQTAASGTDYDGLEIAADLTEYASVRELFENDVLSFWIDPSNDYWDATEDHFGKMKIHSLYWAWPEPDTAVITVAYQRIPGLRWLVTD